MSAQLGAGFAAFTAPGGGAWRVNRALVLAAVPHPTAVGVTFLQGHTRRQAVEGDLAAVLARL